MISAWQPHCRSSANDASLWIGGRKACVSIMFRMGRARLADKVIFGEHMLGHQNVVTWPTRCGGLDRSGDEPSTITLFSTISIYVGQAEAKSGPTWWLEGKGRARYGIFGVMTGTTCTTRLSTPLVPRGVCGAVQRNEPTKVKSPGQGLADKPR